MKKKVDKKIARYWAMKPIVYRHFKSMRFSQYSDRNGWMKQKISIVLASEVGNEQDQEHLYLDFFEVRNLQIQQPETSNVVLSPVEILPGYSLPQIESRYLVRDPEQKEFLWFECGDFEAWIQ